MEIPRKRHYIVRAFVVLALLTYSPPTCQGDLSATDFTYSSQSCSSEEGSCPLCGQAAGFAVIDARLPQTCAGQPYDPAVHRCCGGTLRLRTALKDIALSDVGAGEASNSDFCFAGQHVSSREYVCDGAIVPRGVWDNNGRQTVHRMCCGGKSVAQAEYEYDDATGRIVAARRYGCCLGGTVVDLQASVDAQGVVTQAFSGCCAGVGYSNNASVCCISGLDDALHTAVSGGTCCGTSYQVVNVATQTCCGDKVETDRTSEGDYIGFCCDNNPEQAAAFFSFDQFARFGALPSNSKESGSLVEITALCDCATNQPKTYVIEDQGALPMRSRQETASVLPLTRSYACLGQGGLCNDAAQAVRTGLGTSCCGSERYLSSSGTCRSDTYVELTNRRLKEKIAGTGPTNNAEIYTRGLQFPGIWVPTRGTALVSNPSFDYVFVDAYATREVETNTEVLELMCGSGGIRARVSPIFTFVAVVLGALMVS